MKRLFLGIPLAEPVNDKLDLLCGGIKHLRWVERKNRHITLRFLGDIDGAQEMDVIEALSALDHPSFGVTLEGLGFFPPSQTPKTLWAGLENSNSLFDLKDKCDQLLKNTARIQRDSRKFHPHITLARTKGNNTAAVLEWLRVNNLYDKLDFEVNQVHLYSSILRQQGPVYKIEATKELGI